MRQSFPLAAAADTLLTIVHALSPAFPAWLPLAGGGLSQLGACFGIAYVIVEVVDALRG